MWGHPFFFGSERDFNYGTDAVGFVKSASWYKHLAPPSWVKGGKGKNDFLGKGTGDGRWFFITGGCWFIRTETVRALDWPDRRLIKRNDDVFLCEAIRQHDWQVAKVGGVAINKAKRRGGGEDREAMQRQMCTTPMTTTNEHGKKGCVFLPTFQDTELLIENFANRPELTQYLDFYIYDDNEDDESRKVQQLSEANGWHYRRSGQGKHGDFKQEWRDRSSYVRFIWQSLTYLGLDYEFVAKVDTDAYIIDPTWYEEIEKKLVGRDAIIGTPEVRRTKDVNGFWELAKRNGYEVHKETRSIHMQGGIYAISKTALGKLRRMGFLEGSHTGFGEDCYISYCCQLLGIEFCRASTIGSWYKSYRPKSWKILDRKAIHPMSKSEWIKLVSKQA